MQDPNNMAGTAMEQPLNKEEARQKPSQQRGYISQPIQTCRGTCYRIRYRVRKPGGSSTQKSERLYVAGKKEARAILDQRLQQAAQAARPSPGLCLRDFVFGMWWPYKERHRLSPSTRRSYSSIIYNIVPPIASRSLSEVTPELIAELVKKRRRHAKPKTVINELRLLHDIFELAVNLGLLHRNPVRRQHQPQVEAKATATWTLAQIQAIIAETPAEYRALMTTAALTELRLCELLALSREDIDFARKAIRVRKGRPPRSRLLPVGPRLLQVLADHLERTRPSPPANCFSPAPPGAS